MILTTIPPARKLHRENRELITSRKASRGNCSRTVVVLTRAGDLHRLMRGRVGDHSPHHLELVKEIWTEKPGNRRLTFLHIYTSWREIKLLMKDDSEVVSWNSLDISRCLSRLHSNRKSTSRLKFDLFRFRICFDDLRHQAS